MPLLINECFEEDGLLVYISIDSAKNIYNAHFCGTRTIPGCILSRNTLHEFLNHMEMDLSPNNFETLYNLIYPVAA